MYTALGTVLFFIFIFAVPLKVNALPPPDLIIGVSQSIMYAFGSLTLMFIVIFGALRTRFRTWRSTLFRKVFMYSLGIIIIIFISITLWLYINNQLVSEWKSNVDKELREIWDIYEPIYSAPDELSAQPPSSTFSEKVTWQEFESIINNRDYIVIDIRDSYPYEIGRIEGSINMRFSDILRGRWRELESYKDQPILFVDYLGTTGELVSQFLSRKGFTELYQLKDGIVVSVRRDATMLFLGDTRIPKTKQGALYISLKKAKEVVNSGGVVIDLRAPSYYAEYVGLEVSERFFRDTSTLTEIDVFVQELDHTKKYLFLCQGEVSCYFAGLLIRDFSVAQLEVSAIYNNQYEYGRRNYYE